MKNTILACLILIAFAGCKKEGDGSGKFTNTIWSGVYQSTFYGFQPFVMEFTSDSTLKWHDKSGVWDATCFYIKAEKTIGMQLPGDGPYFKARVSDSNTFEDITNYDIFNELERCERNTSTEQKLKGSEYLGFVMEGGSQVMIRVKFTGESTAEIDVNNGGYKPMLSMERKKGTVLISFHYMGGSNTFFGVIEGSTINAVTPTGTLFLEKQ